MRARHLVALLASLPVSAPEDAPVVEEVSFLEQNGWSAPRVWPAKGMTREAFRQRYGKVWDAVSTSIGAHIRQEDRLKRQEELIDLVDASHRKLPLQGASADSLVSGPSGDHVTENRNYWTVEQAYESMRNKPVLLNEPGHRGQPIFTAKSDSRYGIDPVTFRHELDHTKLLRKVTHSLDTELDHEGTHMLPQRLRQMRQSLTTSYSCQEFPSTLHTSAAAHFDVVGLGARDWPQAGKALLSAAQTLRLRLRVERPGGSSTGPGPGEHQAEEDGARASFALHDTDASGHMSVAEWQWAVRQELGILPTGPAGVSTASLELIFGFIDDNLSGALEEHEFVAFILSGKQSCGVADIASTEAEIHRIGKCDQQSTPSLLSTSTSPTLSRRSQYGH